MEALASVLAVFQLEVLDFWMILVWAAIFVAFWKLMATLFFDPYLKLFETRERLTTGASDFANRQRAEAEQLSAEYDQKIGAARVEAMQQKLQKLSEAGKQAAAVLADAENEAAQYIQAERDSLLASLDQMKQEAFKEADAMADAVVQKLKTPPTIVQPQVH